MFLWITLLIVRLYAYTVLTLTLKVALFTEYNLDNAPLTVDGIMAAISWICSSCDAQLNYAPGWPFFLV